jgi:hypothetical protein
MLKSDDEEEGISEKFITQKGYIDAISRLQTQTIAAN